MNLTEPLSIKLQTEEKCTHGSSDTASLRPVTYLSASGGGPPASVAAVAGPEVRYVAVTAEPRYIPVTITSGTSGQRKQFEILSNKYWKIKSDMIFKSDYGIHGSKSS